MSCKDCKDECRQGRDCPNNKPIEFRKIWKWILKTITRR
jgi:hypothetical protein